MENRPDTVDDTSRTKLAEWHRSISTDPALYAEWDDEFRSSNFGSRIPLNTLVRCLLGSLGASKG